MADMTTQTRPQPPGGYAFQGAGVQAGAANQADPAASVASLPEYIARHKDAEATYSKVFAQMRSAGYTFQDAYVYASEARRAVYIRHESDALIKANPPDLGTAKGRKVAQLKEGLDHGLIAADVYYDQSIPELLPASVRRLTDAQFRKEFGIDPAILVNKETGFASAVYHDAANDRYVLATRGTDDFVDWTLNNIPQGLDLYSPQHAQGIKLARMLNTVGPTKPVILVGHSLGGSVASAQSLATGWPATTFNSASVETGTQRRFGLDASGASNTINAYYIRGEALSAAQDHLLLRSRFGITHDPLDSALGQRHSLPAVSIGKNPINNDALSPGQALGPLSAASSTLSLHRMPRVMESLIYELGNAASTARDG